MPVEEELSRISPEQDTLLTIGVFDGVHLGHRHLISRLKERARERGLLGGVVTFRQHPQELFSPRTPLPALTSLEEKVSLIRAEGVAVVVALTFDRELAQLTHRQFIGLLEKHLRMRGLVIGPDFALGRGRQGDIEAVRALGKEKGFTVEVVPPFTVDGEVVSSTAIRGALVAGDVAKVHRMAGRYFSLRAPVVTGVGRGLAFPTANMGIEPGRALPADGVYATWAYVDGKRYPSMTNIGRNPTFDARERTVEVLILDYQGNLYGREIGIDLVERLRGEKKFASKQELEKQIAVDVEKGRNLLGEDRG